MLATKSLVSAESSKQSGTRASGLSPWATMQSLTAASIVSRGARALCCAVRPGVCVLRSLKPSSAFHILLQFNDDDDDDDDDDANDEKLSRAAISNAQTERSTRADVEGAKSCNAILSSPVRQVVMNTSLSVLKKKQEFDLFINLLIYYSLFTCSEF